MLLEHARRVLGRIPARGIPLSRLAADTLGDSHALDAGQPVAALVLHACRAEEAGARPSGDAGANSPGPRDSDSRRDQWARLGFSTNELAAPVLCLNLLAPDETPSARLATLAAECGEPVHLSLRALLRDAPSWPPGIVTWRRVPKSAGASCSAGDLICRSALAARLDTCARPCLWQR